MCAIDLAQLAFLYQSVKAVGQFATRFASGAEIVQQLLVTRHLLRLALDVAKDGGIRERHLCFVMSDMVIEVAHPKYFLLENSSVVQFVARDYVDYGAGADWFVIGCSSACRGFFIEMANQLDGCVADRHELLQQIVHRATTELPCRDIVVLLVSLRWESDRRVQCGALDNS